MKRNTLVTLAILALVAGAVYVYRGKPRAWFTAQFSRSAPAASQSHAGHNSAAASGRSAKNAPAPGTRKILYWVDPMHPAYKSDKPGIAPDCGMELVPVYADEAEHLAKMPPGTIAISTERQQLIGVKLGRVVAQPVRRTIRAVAKLAYDETKIVHYHNKVEGWIEEVFVNSVGAPVHDGDALFTLYSPELVSAQQEYLIAWRAKKHLAESPRPELARSTEVLLEAARRRLQLWDVTDDQIRRLEQTGEPQRTITFYSHHNGFVLEKKAFEHLRVTQDTDLYIFADLSSIWAIAEVYEYEVPLVHVGQSATMRLSYFPGKVYTGKVAYVYPTLDPATRTAKVRLEFRNPDFALKPDMFAEVDLQVDYGTHVVVPQEAVLDAGMEQMVFIAHPGGVFEPRKIKMGARVDDRIIVLAGLRPGETIVTSGNFLIDSESRLKSAMRGMKH